MDSSPIGLRKPTTVLGALLSLVMGVSAVRGDVLAPADPIPSAADQAQVILHALDYVAVDYPAFVKERKILDQGEYREQLDFVSQVHILLHQLPIRPERAALMAEARDLLAAVNDRRPGAEVTAVADRLRWAIVKSYDVKLAPRRVPDLGQAPALYAAQCAMCHGLQGRGDGPAAKQLDPTPTNFGDSGRMTQRSIYSLYSTISVGVDGTAMASFGALSDENRWALAFYVANLGVSPEVLGRGARSWQEGDGRRAFSDLSSITARSAREIQDQRGPQAAELLAYLRTRPDVLDHSQESSVATSRRLLRESVEAYRLGRTRPSQALAVASYLDGFELVEASLDTLDRRLRAETEAAMLRYRGMLQEGTAVGQVEVQAGVIEGLLARAQRILDEGSFPGKALFLSAFVILLREGLEAILVLSAMCALLVKTGRRDALRYVHGGWIVALALGLLTWLVASYAVTISGATREMTEGVTALVAASIVLYVGFWMHGKSHAMRWNSFLETRVKSALSARTMWGLALVSFLAVYREIFETVLFYQALVVEAGQRGTVPILGGLGTAAVALLVLGWVIFRGGVRLPLGLFFGVSAVLLALLSVVFAGKGIAALQEAGALSHFDVRFPTIPLLGVYPSLQGLLLQAALITIIVLGFAYRRVKRTWSRTPV